jgi:hypothetical protein
MSDQVRTLTTINSFRPQAVPIHAVFVAVMSYVMGRVMHVILPSKGPIGRFLNPGPVSFNMHRDSIDIDYESSMLNSGTYLILTYVV